MFRQRTYDTPDYYRPIRGLTRSDARESRDKMLPHACLEIATSQMECVEDFLSGAAAQV